MTKTAQLAEARTLYVEKGFTGSQTAQAVGISLTHFYRWEKRYGWKGQREDKLAERKLFTMGIAVSKEDVLNEFKAWIAAKKPDILGAVTIEINDFMQQFKTSEKAVPLKKFYKKISNKKIRS